MLIDFAYQHQSASEVSPHCTHRWRKKVCKKQIHPRFGLKKATPNPSHPPTFFACLIGKGYLEFDPGYSEKWLLLKRQLLWTLDFSFMYPCFFTFFLDLHLKSISPKKQLSKDLQTIFSGHKSYSFLWKKSRVGSGGPYRLKKTTGSDNAPEAEISWRFGAPPRPPAQVDVDVGRVFALGFFAFQKC